jgi:hypothetical protein
MGPLKKSNDPISERERALKAEIAALESRIKKLGHEAANPKPQSTPRSAPVPQDPLSRSQDPIFERVNQDSLKDPPQAVTRQHFNELGLRKYDLSGLIDRVKKHVYGPPVATPKLVNYLAAGSVQGLRSLRYEKRVARNRFIVWSIILAVVVFGVVVAVWQR